MKTIFLSFLIVICAGMVPAADNLSVNGKWQVHSSISGNESDQVCTFTQKADALMGTCASSQGTFQISGTIKGNKIMWNFKSQYEGTPLTVKYEGTLASATTIKGIVNVPEFDAGGEFVATQAK